MAGSEALEEGRESGNLIEPISKPAVAQRAGGICVYLCIVTSTRMYPFVCGCMYACAYIRRARIRPGFQVGMARITLRACRGHAPPNSVMFQHSATPPLKFVHGLGSVVAVLLGSDVLCYNEVFDLV